MMWDGRARLRSDNTFHENITPACRNTWEARTVIPFPVCRHERSAPGTVFCPFTVQGAKHSRKLMMYRWAALETDKNRHFQTGKTSACFPSGHSCCMRDTASMSVNTHYRTLPWKAMFLSCAPKSIRYQEKIGKQTGISSSVSGREYFAIKRKTFMKKQILATVLTVTNVY